MGYGKPNNQQRIWQVVLLIPKSNVSSYGYQLMAGLLCPLGTKTPIFT